MDRFSPRVRRRLPLRRIVWRVGMWLGLGLAGPAVAVAARGELELRVTDSATREPMAVQLQIFNQRRRAVRVPGLVRDGDWQVFDGQAVLRLPPGVYDFRLRRGLEYRERTGQFVIKSGAGDNHAVDLPRFVDMAAEGWWSGDLQVQPSSLAGMATRILASDLHLVPLTCRDNHDELSIPALLSDQLQQGVGAQRTVQWPLAYDRRDGSLVGLRSGAELPRLPASDQWLPTPFSVARGVRDAAPAASPSHIHLAHAACWDLPTWAALGLLDSVGLLHDGLRQQGSQAAPQDRPYDSVLYPDPEGVARWSQACYVQLLESGIRIPPAAGSGTDASGNPLGSARVYVYCGEAFSASRWWEGLRAGQVVVTNGPLLRPRVNGELPGHVFRARTGESLALDVSLQLSTQDKIRYLEILQNGRPVQQVRLEDFVGRGGRLPPVVFEQSGWLLVRAVAEHPDAYRAALSGPFYVEFDDQPRISRQAANYLLDWVYQRARQIREADPGVPQAALVPHRQARDYWQQRADRANVD